MMNAITNRVHHSFTTKTTVLKQRLYSTYSRQMELKRYGSFTSGNTQTPNNVLLTPGTTHYRHKQYDMSKSNILVQQATGITHY